MAVRSKAKPVAQPRKRQHSLGRKKANGAGLEQQLAEARAQQAATAAILKVIARSPSDAQPAFEAIVEHAHRLVGAMFSILYGFDGKTLSVLADMQSSAKASAVLRGMYPAPAQRRHIVGRAVLDGREMHTTDIRADARFPANRNAHAKFLKFQAALIVPLKRGGKVIGAIAAGTLVSRPFSRHEIHLLRTFADQAVIAIENVRLFNETKEALAQQTATADILRVIGASMTDTQPVFQAIVKSCHLLFGSDAVSLRLVRGDTLAQQASIGETSGPVLQISAESPVGMCVLEKRVVNIPDFEAAQAQFPHLTKAGLRMGFRTGIYTPLLRGGEVIGSISVRRMELRAFSDKEAALLKTFADQAVIAIENVRLFNETKESLERQTATAEILKVIAESPSDVQPVFDAIAGTAQRLFNARNAVIVRLQDDMLQLVAHTETTKVGDEALKKLFPTRVTGQGATGKAVVTGRPNSIVDVESDPGYSAEFRAGARARGYRSLLVVPMMRESKAIGAINITRPEPGAFTDPQVKLLQAFADQAVIAIENVRLFNETKEALERQTATAEILKVISSSPTDTKPVFEAIVDACMRLFADHQIGINLVDESGGIRVSAVRSPKAQALKDYLENSPARRDGKRVKLRRSVAHYPDTDAADVPEEVRLGCQATGARSIVYAPLVLQGKGIGSLWVAREEVGAFTDKEIALLKTFADQAVIAIENVRLFNETKEALERQTATAEILKVISSSPTDTRPVFEAIVGSAVRLVAGFSALVNRVEGDTVQLGAMTKSEDPGRDEATRRAYPRPLSGSYMTERTIDARGPFQIADVTIEPGAPDELREMARSRGWRSNLTVPMLRGHQTIGTIMVTRREAGPFSDHHVGLLKTFADQAVIAIENVRLFNETKESLERQTATADILKVIASSPSDVQPVFDTIVTSALKLIGGFSATVRRVVGDQLPLVAFTEPSSTMALESVIPSIASSAAGVAVTTRTAVIVTDTETDPRVNIASRNSARTRGYRSFVSVPMIREGEVIGTINVSRKEPGPFADREVILLMTFADQAVIAIENVRLFNETKESLERQTATAEILKVIASSPSDVQPVFDAIVRSGVQLFSGASTVIIGIADGDQLRAVASAGEGPSAIGLSVPISRESAGGIAILERRLVNVRDTEAPDAPPHARENARILNVRSMIHAPMFREDEAIGTILVTRREPGGLDDKQLALLKTFADQAVIAIENVRLFKELQSRTEALSQSVGQLTALGEVGQAISSTLDLETVLQTIVSRAVQLTGLDGGSVYEYDERSEEFRLQAADNQDSELLEAVRRTPIRKGDGTVGSTAVTLEATQVSDILDAGYQSSRRELLIRAGYRAILTVPLLREDRVIGALSVTRKTPGPFGPEIVELLKTFATQSAMAIQNARLFREIADKGKQLEIASRHKSDFLANMSHELRTPLNAIIGFSEVLIERMFGELNEKQADYMKDIHESGRHLLSLINDILDLSKIEAGRMDLDIAAFDLPSSLANAMTLVRERAQRSGIALGLEVDPSLGEFRADERKVKQILLNLLSNAVKFTPEGGRVAVTATRQGGAVQIAVKDSGIGIAPEDHAAVFEEFKQVGSDYTRKAEGTGLGLALTRRFVELHGGEIRLESQPGKGSTFTFTLPVRT